MKEFMLGMMLPMFPYMKTIFMTGAGLGALGLVALILGLIFSHSSLFSLARSAGLLALLFGLFFLACQAAGMYLSTPPMINFGDSSKFEFINIDFWKLGLGLFIIGYFTRKFAKAK